MSTVTVATKYADLDKGPGVNWNIPFGKKPSDALKGKRMYMVGDSATAKKLYFPYAPQNIQYSGFGMKYGEVAREGVRKPLLIPNGLYLKKLSFQVTLTSPRLTTGWDFWLKECEGCALTGSRIKIHYGSSFEGLRWKITNYSFSSVLRHPKTGGITEATVDLEFTESPDIAYATGPTKGGISDSFRDGTLGNGGVSDSFRDGTGPKPLKPNTPAKKPSTSKTPKKTAVRTYTIRSGDTLSGIAVKFYKNASMWTRIASLNKISDPRKLRVGQVLKLP